MSNYLFELGVEELPYKFISSAISQLKVAFEKLLNEYSLPFESVNVYATPRRLAVLVKNVALAQADSEKVIKGPIASIAYNPDGTFSKAALGFAAKNNVAEEFLYVQDNYLYAKVKTVGKSFEEILVSNISDVILKLQGPHFMRWSNHDEKFARPIRWIVSMLDNAHLPLTILDISSSDITRGHRFSENKTLKISSPDTYVEELKKANVFVNQDERRELIKTLVKSKADELSAEVDFDDDLLDEVTYICEYPAAVVCDFDEKYLDIPQEVAVTVMKVHQRYFPLYKNGKLINKFVTVTNFVGNDFENIKAGNLRVIKARLDDAVFFYNEDTKISLESYLEKLKGITFQKNMGSVFDKTQRIIKLSSFIAEKLNLSNKTVDNALNRIKNKIINLKK